jgi:hypothetical protein
LVATFGAAAALGATFGAATVFAAGAACAVVVAVSTPTPSIATAVVVAPSLRRIPIVLFLPPTDVLAVIQTPRQLTWLITIRLSPDGSANQAR